MRLISSLYSRSSVVWRYGMAVRIFFSSRAYWRLRTRSWLCLKSANWQLGRRENRKRPIRGNEGQDYKSLGPKRRPVSAAGSQYSREGVGKEDCHARIDNLDGRKKKKKRNKANQIFPAQQSRSTTSSAFSNLSVRPAVSGKTVQPPAPTNQTNPFIFHVSFSLFSLFHLFGFSSVTQFSPTPRGSPFLPVPCEKKKTALFSLLYPLCFCDDDGV